MKIIVWGHKLHTHTHSYIHSSYYNTFKYLGHEVYWIDIDDRVEESFFKNSVVFSEGRNFETIPVIKGNKYITHHADENFFHTNDIPEESVLRITNYIEESEKFERINDLAHYDSSNRTLYQSWATNLLPGQIEPDSVYSIGEEHQNKIDYVGSLYEESLTEAFDLARELKKLNFFFALHRNMSDDQNQDIIRKTLVSLDIRARHHKEVGYIPCRIFKNISYGRVTGTNSKNVKRIFGDHVVYDDNVITLFYRLLLEENTTSKQKRKDSVKFIKDNHTFVNRAENILKLF